LLRDIFYTSQRNLYDLFKIGICGHQVDSAGFRRIIDEVGGSGISESDCDLAFKLVSINNKITFDQFEKRFKSEVPNGLEFETKVVRQVREWMFRSNLSSELAFDGLCRSVACFHTKRLNRAQFHRAMASCEVGLSAAKTDSLFAALASEA